MMLTMLNIVSLIIGVVALLLGILAFFPFLGWAYWAIIPLALIGFAFGQMSSSRSGRNLNLVVVVIGIVRLAMGGGII
jgi:TRAP-type mannitol/chloroaromatic compound transport system permease small subunit